MYLPDDQSHEILFFPFVFLILIACKGNKSEITRTTDSYLVFGRFYGEYLGGGCKDSSFYSST